MSGYILYSLKTHKTQFSVAADNDVPGRKFSSCILFYALGVPIVPNHENMMSIRINIFPVFRTERFCMQAKETTRIEDAS